MQNAHTCHNLLAAIQSFKDRAFGFHVDLTTRLIRQLSLTDRQNSISDQDEDEFEKWGYFAILPVRIVFLTHKFINTYIHVCSMYVCMYVCIVCAYL